MDDHVERVTAALTAARHQRIRFHQAIIDLEEAAAAPAPGREKAWMARVGEALETMREALAQHAEVTEAPDGLLAEIRGEQPRLDHRTRELAADHRVLAEMVDAAAARLARDPDPVAVEAAREALSTLLTRLFRHRQHGLDLVYEAYMTDLGVGD